jgi:polysaccharide pyruvyl transferase WcaK-like protein
MSGSQEHVNDVIVRAATYLLDRGWSIEFLPMHKMDYHIGLSLARQLGSNRVTAVKLRRTPAELLLLLSRYDFLIGQRLHAVILGCGTGIPCVGLEYRTKVGDFMESVGMSQFSVGTDIITADQLIGLIDKIDLNHTHLSRQLISRCDEYRAIQRDVSHRFAESILS